MEEINAGKVEELEARLAQFQGLTEIKLNIYALIRLLEAWKSEQAQRISYVSVPLHLIFAGESGTGKTQAAELMAQIYHALGFLSEGNVIQKNAGCLLVPLSEAFQNQIHGNVLLLHDLGSLTEEAATRLLSLMDANADLAVILMGTESEIQQALEKNPMLRLKICKYFGFADFQGEDFEERISRRLEIFDVSSLAEQEEQLEALEEAEFPPPVPPLPKPMKLDARARIGTMLQPGARFDLTHYLQKEIRVRLVYERLKLNMELDAYVYLLHDDEKTACDEDMIFFGNIATKNRGAAIVEGADYPEAAFVLNRMHPDIHKIAVCFSAYGNHPAFDFSQIERPMLQIFCQGKQLAYMDLKHLQAERTVVAVEFYRYQQTWRIRAVAAGYRDGLEELCHRFGIEVA